MSLPVHALWVSYVSEQVKEVFTLGEGEGGGDTRRTSSRQLDSSFLFCDTYLGLSHTLRPSYLLLCLPPSVV